MRQDPVTGVWTVVAPGRAGRPKDFSRTMDEVADASTCPFCAGHEGETPPTRLEIALPGENGWTVRVFENRFPSLTAAADDDGCRSLYAPAPYRGRPGFGAHEIVVETPRHGEGLADYAPEHATALVDAYADRIAHWREDGRFAAAVIFRNFGRAAGASLSHAHTQIVAMPCVPDTLVRELGNFCEAASVSGRCVLCDAIAVDDAGGRGVFDDGVTGVHSPWAAPIPYFMRIAPRGCAPTLADVAAEGRASFGEALVAAAKAVRGVFGDVAFNVVVNDAPYSAQHAGLPFHWHAEVILRTSDQAGFEWGSGTFINMIDPDDAARALRDALASG
jgi:UDPglucose--hexose-1-phosphate uridylyltransferase